MALPASRIVLVSAHPDDVALSVGGLVHRFERASLVLITCFTMSCSSNVDDAAETTSVRAAEDEAYARHLRAGLIRLGFADTSIRTRRGASPTCQASETQLRSDLRDRLEAAIRDVRPDIVFVPLAIGAHEDHVHCQNVVAQMPCSYGLVFYEDLPYAQSAGGPDHVAETVRKQFPNLRPRRVWLSAAEMNAKFRGLDCYRSQIHPLWRRDVEQYALGVGVSGRHAERIWLAPPYAVEEFDEYEGTDDTSSHLKTDDRYAL